MTKHDVAQSEQFKKIKEGYLSYKRRFVRNIRFSNSTTVPYIENIPNSTIELVHIFFDTASYDEIERDTKIKFEGQLSLIGGTMGLLTGFSIISGVKILYFLAKFVTTLMLAKIKTFVHLKKMEQMVQAISNNNPQE